MSVPNTMKIGPFIPSIIHKRRYILLYIFIAWASFIPIFLLFWVYWQIFWDFDRPFHFYTFLPLLVVPFYVLLVFSAIFFARILYSIINIIHKPREGVFLRHIKDRDFKYWCIRNMIKRWPFWLSHKFPFPFMDNICFKAFGVKTKFSNSLFEGWCDTEFLEFGKNVVIGQGSIVQSSIIIGNLLIIRKTVIEDDVRVGSHSIILPGTKLGYRSILAANSSTTVGQILEQEWIYLGVPAKKFKRNYFFRDGLQEKMSQVEDVDILRAKYEESYVKRYDELTRKERKEIRKEKKEEEKEVLDEIDYDEWDVLDDGFNI